MNINKASKINKTIQLTSISDDIEIMEKIACKDRKAYETIINIYMDDIYRFCYSLVKETSQAEDITQEVFLKLWKSADRWKPTGRAKNWLLKIAYNLTIDNIRKSKNHTDIDKVAHNLEDYKKLPDEQTHQNFIKDSITDAILTLPDRQKSAIMLSYYSECSNKESAKIMDISVDAFESLLARGKRNLKDFLKDIKDKI